MWRPPSFQAGSLSITSQDQQHHRVHRDMLLQTGIRGEENLIHLCVVYGGVVCNQSCGWTVDFDEWLSCLVPFYLFGRAMIALSH